MSPVRAILVFPLRSADATAALAGRRIAWAVPLVPALLAGAWLQARGCAARDAWTGASAVLGVVLGLGLGGLAGTYPARLLLGQEFRPRQHAGGCLVFATWAPILFALALALAHVGGAREKAALAAGFALLIWGVVAGIGTIGGGEAEEYGRAVVASCLGLAVSLLGFVTAMVVIHGQLLLVVPAPVAAEGFRPGDILLVRRTAEAGPGSLVLLGQEGSREAVLARAAEGGRFEPVGAAERALEEGVWAPAGRVFFRFGGPWGGSPVP